MTAAVAAPQRTVPGFLAWRTALDPDHVAIEVRAAGHEPARLTLADWDARASVVAASLWERGVGHGDRIGLVFGEAGWIDFAVAYCGVQRAGAIAVPLSERLAPVQIERALTQCDAALVIHGGGAAGLSGAVTLADLTICPPAAGGASVRPGDLAQIIYTSGTTGQPKGVAATHANLSIGAPAHPRRLRLAHSSRFTHAFAIGTNGAQTMLLNALYAKPGAVVLAQATPHRFARLLAEPDVGTVFMVPSLAIELLGSGALDGRDLSHVKLAGSTAAPLPPAVAVRLASAFPNAAIVNYYTSTEAAPAEVSMIFDLGRPEALGRPATAEVVIADADGNPVAAGVTGDVWLRSPFPRAYYRDAEATKATFVGEHGEWVRMSDRGRIDADGYLYLTGRHQDIVKTGAFKVSTVEIEAVLHEHPLIRDAAVVGVPDPVLGSALAAVVVPTSDAAADELTLPALRRFLFGRLADYQIPGRLLLCDRLPRNSGGKVLKRQLLESFTDAKEGRP